MPSAKLASVDDLYKYLSLGFLVRVYSDEVTEVSDLICTTLEIYNAGGFGYGFMFEGFCQYFIYNGKNEFNPTNPRMSSASFSEEEKASFCEALADHPKVTKVELGDEVDLRFMFNSFFNREKVFK